MKFSKLLRCALALAVSFAGVARAQSVSVTGSIAWQDRAIAFGGLSTALTTRLARFTDVNIVDPATTFVVATTFTGANGSYSVQVNVPPSRMLRAVALSSSSRAAAAGQCPVSAQVIPPAITAPFAVPGAAFTVPNGAASVSLGTLLVPELVVPLFGLNAGGHAWNILDLAISAFQHITAMGFPPAPQPVLYTWPVPTSGVSSAVQPNMAFIDFQSGYDDPVILHETGHIVEFLYSNFTQPGGAHFFGDSDQDPRLSWSEGWATYFGASVMRSANVGALLYPDPGFYLDTFATPVAGVSTIALRARLETRTPFDLAAPGPARAWGEADELAVAAILWDITDNANTLGNGGIDDDPLDGIAGFAPVNGEQVVFGVFSGAMNNPQIQNSTLGTFWDAWLLSGGVQQNLLVPVFAGNGVNFTIDPFEPNSSQAQAVGFGPSPGFVGGLTFYRGPASAVVPSSFDLDEDWYTFQLTAGSTFDVETRYPQGAIDAETMADPMVAVRGPSGQELAPPTEGGGAGRNARLSDVLALESGPQYVIVSPSSNTSGSPGRRYGDYELRIQMTFVNGAPVVTSALSNVSAISTEAGMPVALSATASDPDNHPLTYQWYLIDGSQSYPLDPGPNVAWQPPAYPSTYDVTFQVVARDSLGAPSAPVSLVVRVAPPGAIWVEGSTSPGGTAVVSMSTPYSREFWLAMAANSAPPTTYPGVSGALELEQASLFVLQQGFSPFSGIVSASLAIPQDPGLVGQDFFFQGLFETSGGHAFSDLLQVFITP